VPDQTEYWFRAKRYGWGWGLPIRWQGWAVLIAFIVLLSAGAMFISPAEALGWYVTYAILLAVALLAIAKARGEPPSSGRRDGGG
jgi:hypothetical protein